MRKNKAKKLIKELQDSLNNENIIKQFWMDKVEAYVGAIFGNETQSIALPMFHTYYGDRPYSKWIEDKTINKNIEALKDLFDTYIVLIDNDLIMHRNWFSKFENWGIIGVLASIIVTSFSIGYGTGSIVSKYDQKVEQNELKDTVKSLKLQVAKKDSILVKKGSLR